MGIVKLPGFLNKIVQPSGKQETKKAKKSEKQFGVDSSDEAFILKLTDDIVEDVVYTLGLDSNQLATMGVLGRENPYRSKEIRELLKYEMNIALRKLERDKKIHLGKGKENGQTFHPLVPYLKFHLFNAVHDEIMSPSQQY